MTTFESHKADLRMQIRLALSDTRKQMGRRPPPNNHGGKLTEWRKLWNQLEDQMRLLDAVDALKEGDPLPLGWQDLRL